MGPGGAAVFKVQDADRSGTLELSVYDDGTRPENPKASRVGPRWGLVRKDGRLLAVGILYASYLGGSEGYTATSCDGRDWFDQFVWLGVNRGAGRWHRWTFDFDPEIGLRILHDGKDVSAFDPEKARLDGFTSVAIWGDSGAGAGQTIWVDDLSTTSGVQTTPVVKREADPYAAVEAPPAIPIYTRTASPPRPRSTTCPRGGASLSTASPGRSTARPGSAGSSTATGTSWAR